MGKKVPVMGSVILSLLLIIPVMASTAAGEKTPQHDGFIALHPGSDEITDPISLNLGQWDDDISYMGDTSFGHIAFSESSIYLDISGPENEGAGCVLKLTFPLSNVVSPEGEDLLEYRSNYFLGNDPDQWYSSVPSFGKVVYRDLWEGIDLEYSIIDGNPKYQFTVQPGSDPDLVRIRVDGMEHLMVDDTSVRMETGPGISLIDSDLVVFHTDDREIIDGSFREIDENTFGFDLGDYDHDRSITIDPLLYSTFLGGSSTDQANDIAVTSNGEAYVTGTTYSSDFPLTSGVYYTSKANYDVIVTRFNQGGTDVDFSTYIGGSSSDYGNEIAIDDFGYPYVTGYTSSSNFPQTASSSDLKYKSGDDTFVFKLNPQGTVLVYSCVVGGLSTDFAYAIQIDGSGNAYVAGETYSSGFPLSNDAYQSYIAGRYDAFVYVLNPSGSDLSFSTYFGGSNYDQAIDLRVDRHGNIYFVGDTTSTDLPTTDGSYNKVSNGGNDLFAVKLNMTHKTLDFCTFIGGSSSDYAYGMTMNSHGDTFITGYTSSSDFPLSDDAFDRSMNGGYSAYVLGLDNVGKKLRFSTYLGGSSYDYGYDIEIDSSGSPYIVGYTSSSDFPKKSSGSYDWSHNGGDDGFFVKFNQNASDLFHASFVGSTSTDQITGLDLLDDISVYVTGRTSSPDFPTMTGSYDTIHNGGDDAFVFAFEVVHIPGPPRKLVGIEGDGWVDLTWSPSLFDGNSEIEAYRIYRSTSTSGGAKIGEVNPDVFTFNDTAKENGQTYYYFVRAINSIGVSPDSNRIKIEDTILPRLVQDLTPDHATTGDEFTFVYRIVDNIEVQKAKLEYWYGSEIHKKLNLENSETDIWEISVVIEHRLDDLHYIIQAWDASDVTNITREIVIPILDNDGPELTVDLSSKEATTNDTFKFEFGVEDNIGVYRGWVEYWNTVEGEKTDHVIMDLSIGNYSRWEGTLTMFDSEGNFSYRFHSNDTQGNVNSSEIVQMEIVDNDLPVLLEDLTPTITAPASEITFSVLIYENVGINDIWLNYWYQNGTEDNGSLEEGVDGEYHFTMDVEPTISPIHYVIHAVDRSGNELVSEEKIVTIRDRTAPEILSDHTLTTTVSGGSVDFIVKASDNHKVASVTIEYWFTEDEMETFPLKSSEGNYLGTFDIPLSEDRNMVYRIRAVDKSGNNKLSQKREITVNDEINPEIEPVPDLTVYAGKDIHISITAVDNIRIATIDWIGAPLPGIEYNLTGKVWKSGDFEITVRVTDPSGNQNSRRFHLIVLAETHDTDEDGIPDLFEMEYGMDWQDPSDGSLDPDSDGLTNLEEYLNGTNMEMSDTDLDGMPDGWEVKYGLDPMSYSKEKDSDGDGIGDWQEFIDGTDPTVENKGIDIAAILVVLGIILLIATISACGFLIIRAKREARKDQVDIPEPGLMPVQTQDLAVSDYSLLPAAEVPYMGEIPPEEGYYQDAYPTQEPMQEEVYPQGGDMLTLESDALSGDDQFSGEVYQSIPLEEGSPFTPESPIPEPAPLEQFDDQGVSTEAGEYVNPEENSSDEVQY